MAELNKENGLLTFVNYHQHDFGQVGPEETIEYSFEFLGSEQQIEYIEKGCGCTSAYWDAETNSIKGELDLSKANGSQEYPKGETSVLKHIFVWMNDGQSRFVANSLKEKQHNPKKSFFRLELVGKVVS